MQFASNLTRWERERETNAFEPLDGTIAYTKIHIEAEYFMKSHLYFSSYLISWFFQGVESFCNRTHRYMVETKEGV